MRTSIGIYGIPDDGSRFSEKGNTHDHGICSVAGGRVRHCVQLERYTGRKHDNRMPEYLSALLGGIAPEDGDYRLLSVNSFLGSGLESADGEVSVSSRDLEVGKVMASTDAVVRGERVEARIVCHEFAHIASCLPFTGDFEEGSLLVHIDGGASDSASSVWTWEAGRPVLRKCSWDELKAAANMFNVNPLAQAILGLGPEDHLSMPGKLMGYASWGRSDPAIIRWMSDNGWFFGWSQEELLREVNGFFGTSKERFDTKDPDLMDIAASMQEAFEEIVTSFMKEARSAYGSDVLYYSGGAALNINENHRIREECGFRKVFIPPCCSDSGLALGAAAYADYLDNGPLEHHAPFLDDSLIMGKEARERSLAGAEGSIASGEAVGVCAGRGEIGPRALGHRSILARADDIALRRRVSEEMKGREWYRPVAPVMTDDVAAEVLEGYDPDSELCRYMLDRFSVKEAYRDGLKGVMHKDGTVRAQVVSKDDPGCRELYGLLVRLRRDHGIIALIQTSFNEHGRPMVQTASEAEESGRKMGLSKVICDD